MRSPFANLFTAIQKHIETKFPGVFHIDQDLGQLDYYQTKPPVNFPCILIDFDNFTSNNYSDNVQELNGDVAIRLAFAPYSSTSGSTPQLYREKGLNYYDLEFSLHQALQGWIAGDYYGSLNRSSLGTEKREDAIRVRYINYSIQFEDYSTKSPSPTATATPDISTRVFPSMEVLGS